MPGLYFRKIKIYRPTPVTNASGGLQVGGVGYAGMQTPTAATPGNEPLVFKDIPASIQAEALGNNRASDVPASSPGPIKWSIYIPRSALNLGDVVDRDIAVDDLGSRYQIAASYYNVLGYKLLTIRLLA